MELYIVIAIFLFMIVGFCLNKWPFGLTTMTCCILLVVTGIMPIEDAFSGFAMKNFVLIAGSAGRAALLTPPQAQIRRIYACFLPRNPEKRYFLPNVQSVGSRLAFPFVEIENREI